MQISKAKWLWRDHPYPRWLVCVRDVRLILDLSGKFSGCVLTDTLVERAALQHSSY